MGGWEMPTLKGFMLLPLRVDLSPQIYKKGR